MDILPQTTHQKPIAIYPESAVLRQEILQELRNRIEAQCIELKKTYDIEPTRGTLMPILSIHLHYIH